MPLFTFAGDVPDGRRETSENILERIPNQCLCDWKFITFLMKSSITAASSQPQNLGQLMDDQRIQDSGRT
jgi:hypothetical protein